jgi:hypothetical protein
MGRHSSGMKRLYDPLSEGTSYGQFKTERWEETGVIMDLLAGEKF